MSHEISTLIFQLIAESPAKDALINTFAIGSKMGIAIGWGTLVVLTMEVYPTVIRYSGCMMFGTVDLNSVWCCQILPYKIIWLSRGKL